MTPDPTRRCTLLLVDDEEANLDLLEAFLRGDGYASLVRTSDARRAVPLFEEHAPDLVLLDLHMPHRSGFQVLEEIRARTPPGDYLPVLVLTADVTSGARERALSGGARDFLTKPFDVTEVLLRVRNLLETRVLHREERAARASAEAAAARAGLLAEVSRALGASLDCATGLAQLARRAVPLLGDLCVVELLRDGVLAPAGVAHADPAREAALRAALDPVPAAGHPLAELFRGERARVLPGALGDGPEASGLRALPSALLPGATLVAPLRAAGRTVGALVLVRPGAGRAYAADELALAEELARRAAAAVENAGLFAQAQEATRARDHTLAVVAHDLRNPLASVAMSAEMLLHTLPPRAGGYERETLTAIHQAAGRMHRLVEDLLDVARLELGAFTLEAEEHDPADILEEAEAVLRPLAAARCVRLEVEPPAGLPPVRADAVRVLQVLSNLVGNAVKFTPEGGCVTVSCAPEGDALRVSVADTGPGISAEHLPHVFGEFWQGSTRDRRGAGLGLSIARALVEAQGGRIGVASREGEGTTVHFTLPLAGPAARPAEDGVLVVQA